MNNTVRNILVVLGGMIIGGALNGLIINYAHLVVPTPEGFDKNNLDTFHLLQPMNFLMVFLAHALGTLLASFIITKFTASHHYKLAMIPGILFLVGGILMTQMVDAPFWYDAIDLLLAYFPMAYFGYLLGRNKK